MTFLELSKELEQHIANTYDTGVTMEEAERLAAKFLHAQMVVSAELRRSDLNARMRKSGLKAIRAAVYANAIASADKKPTEGQLEHTLNMDSNVSQEQDGLDEAEVQRDELNRLYSVFQAAHVYYRQISKGNFNG